MAVLGMVEARTMVLLQEDEHVGSSFEKGARHIEGHLRTHNRPKGGRWLCDLALRSAVMTDYFTSNDRD